MPVAALIPTSCGVSATARLASPCVPSEPPHWNPKIRVIEAVERVFLAVPRFFLLAPFFLLSITCFVVSFVLLKINMFLGTLGTNPLGIL